jgi:hypothetical protein
MRAEWASLGASSVGAAQVVLDSDADKIIKPHLGFDPRWEENAT